MSLPSNTYYQDGALINGNHDNTTVKQKIQKLEDSVGNLIEEIQNVNQRLDELSNTEINTAT